MNAPEHDVPLSRARDLFARPGPIPEIRLRGLTGDNHPSIIQRSASSSSSSSSSSTSCGPNDTTGPCQRSTGSAGSTVPIVIGVIIPVTIIAIILFVVYRRRVTIKRKEDREDKYRSLDFGVYEKQLPSKKKSIRGRIGSKKGGEMATYDFATMRKDKGLSMDLNLTNPYLLPPALHQSSESLRSLSRNMSHGDDKYRTTDFVPDDGSIRSPSVRGRRDDSSTYTASTQRRFDLDSGISGFPRPPRSEPSRTNSPAPPAPPKPAMLAPPKLSETDRNSTISSVSSNGVSALRASNTYLGAFIHGGMTKEDTKTEKSSVPTATVTDLGTTIPEGNLTSPPEEVNRKSLPTRSTSIHNRSVTNSLLPEARELQPLQLNFTSSPLSTSPVPEPAAEEQSTLTQTDNQYEHHHTEQNNSTQDFQRRHNSTEQYNDNDFATRSQQPSSGLYNQNQAESYNHYSQGQYSQYQDQHYDSRNHYSQHQDDHYNHASHYSQNQQYNYQQQYSHDDQYYQGGHNEHSRGQQYNYGEQYGYDQQYNQSAHASNSHQQPTLPHIQVQQHQDDDAASDYYDDEEGYDEYADYVGYADGAPMMGLRPLPPDDPSEDPEHRANRIRSFYKEYFEESSKPGGRQSYFLDDGAFDEVYGYYEQTHPTYRAPSAQYDRRRAYSNGSHLPGPRAYSSMSGRYGGPRMRPMKKKLPPPKPLQLLPTPYKLKDDDFIPNAIDFAPPQAFRNQRSGTPDSLRGGSRPYSPSVRAHVPLTSSFDDLAVIPSPHQLRKSGLFTGLDFAPPRRFRDGSETMSETGSIRSNRSNISAMHVHNIRAGAYRVSRIPKEVAGTKTDIMDALRPQWDIGR